MSVYKIKGKIDPSGQLIITEPINIAPGDVEVIILKSVTSNKQIPKVKSLEELLETAPPISFDFEPEKARWEALKEKYNL